MSKVIDLLTGAPYEARDKIIQDMARNAGLELSANPSVTISKGYPISRAKYDYTLCDYQDAIERLDAAGFYMREAYREWNAGMEILRRIEE